MWNAAKELTIITFVGFSFYATSFIISLLLGTAAFHPILGTLDELVRSVELIIITSIIFFATLRLYDILIQPKRRAQLSAKTLTIR